MGSSSKGEPVEMWLALFGFVSVLGLGLAILLSFVFMLFMPFQYAQGFAFSSVLLIGVGLYGLYEFKLKEGLVKKWRWGCWLVWVGGILFVVWVVWFGLCFVSGFTLYSCTWGVSGWNISFISLSSSTFAFQAAKKRGELKASVADIVSGALIVFFIGYFFYVVLTSPPRPLSGPAILIFGLLFCLMFVSFVYHRKKDRKGS
jgi:hypothetical protein